MFGDRGRDGEEGQERNVEEGVAGKRFSDEEGERGRRDELFEVEEPEGNVVSNTHPPTRSRPHRYPSARQSTGGNPHWGHSYLQIPREQTIFSTSLSSIIDSPRLNTSHHPSTCTYPNRGNQLPMRGGTLSTHAILQERGTLTYPIAPR